MLGRLSLDRFHADPHCSGPNDVLAARYRRAATRGLIVLCVAFLLMGAPGVMADQIAGETHAASAKLPDQEIGLLLLKVEQQIAAGHAVDPESDNALDTWQAVITKAHPASPETLKALAVFAAHMRDRAEAETAAGRSLASTDFSAFAEAANDLLKDVAPTSSPQGPQANASRSAGTVRASSGSAAATTDSATSGVAPTAGPAAPGNSPPADATGTNATRPPTPAAQPTLDAAASAAHLVTGAPATQEQSVAALYASRGDQMLAIKDVSAARRFYQYAANAGSAGAATALARTFDPSFLSQSGVIGLRPDPAQAAVWYRKAAELGDRNAETRLQGVSAEVAK